MCGIVGMAGDGISARDHDVFQELLQCSIVRGHHGTGIFQGEFKSGKKKTWLIEKKPVDPVTFFNWCKSKDGNKLILNSIWDNVYIGHARYATTGDLSVSNCHPFEVDHLVGVHNGTMDDWEYWHRDITDSELLYKDIAERGTVEVLKDVSPESAYALVYFDKEKMELSFVRSAPPKTRTLFICANKDRDVIYWASEMGMLEWILDRNGINHHEILTFAPNKVYSIKLVNIDHRKELLFDIEAYTPRELTKKEKKEKKKQEHYYTEWWDNYLQSESVQKMICDQNGIPWEEEKSPEPKKGVIIPKSGKIPHKKCWYCTHEMSLVEQYFSRKIKTSSGDTNYECNNCEKLNKSLAANNTNVVSLH